MATPQEMHKIVATRPMVQTKMFLHVDAIPHQSLLCARRSFLGHMKYGPWFKWTDEPGVEDDFAPNGDFGWLRSYVRSINLWRHKAAALHMGTRNCTVSPERKPSISYSCSLDAVALVLQSTGKVLVLQNTGTTLVLRSR